MVSQQGSLGICDIRLASFEVLGMKKSENYYNIQGEILTCIHTDNVCVLHKRLCVLDESYPTVRSSVHACV